MLAYIKINVRERYNLLRMAVTPNSPQPSHALISFIFDLRFSFITIQQKTSEGALKSSRHRPYMAALVQ